MTEAQGNVLRITLKEIIKSYVPAAGFEWLLSEVEGVSESGDAKRFSTAFVMMPRKTGKAQIQLTESQLQQVQNSTPGYSVANWTVERLARVFLLMHFPSKDKARYVEVIENLFLNAEMNELVALYSSLPVLEFPELWRLRCAEGIRNNIAQVLESIMCNSPYPAEQLEEAAWNQLVLKAIFTDKPLLQIYNLRERSNEVLAHSISFFAHERWAAGRQVNPLVWTCVVRFVDAQIFADIQRLGYSIDSAERYAAALVCKETSYTEAKQFLNQHAELKSLVDSENISWADLDQLISTSQHANA